MAVKVVDYPELKSSLTEPPRQHRKILAFPGEPVGVTDSALHYIRLKPYTKPVYIPAYRLLHNQRIIVDNMIKDILEQGVIQDSHSPWNSPLFLFPPKNRTFNQVIDFRRVNAVTLDEHYPLPILSDFFNVSGQR